MCVCDYSVHSMIAGCADTSAKTIHALCGVFCAVDGVMDVMVLWMLWCVCKVGKVGKVVVGYRSQSCKVASGWLTNNIVFFLTGWRRRERHISVHAR